MDECRSEIEHLEGRGFLEPEGERVKAALVIQAGGNQSGSIEACRRNLLDDPNNRQLRLELGQALAAAGNYQEALDVLLAIVQEDKTGDGDTAREKMIEIFRLLPDDSELTTDYRRQLSLALY